MKISFHQAVQQEVEEACHWYDERKENLGDEFFQELKRALERIRENPQAFPPAPFGRRKAPMKRFPHVVCYRVMKDRVRILCVHHEKRHPLTGARRR